MYHLYYLFIYYCRLASFGLILYSYFAYIYIRFYVHIVYFYWIFYIRIIQMYICLCTYFKMLLQQQVFILYFQNIFKVSYPFCFCLSTLPSPPKLHFNLPVLPSKLISMISGSLWKRQQMLTWKQPFLNMTDSFSYEQTCMMFFICACVQIHIYHRLCGLQKTDSSIDSHLLT